MICDGNTSRRNREEETSINTGDYPCSHHNCAQHVARSSAVGVIMRQPSQQPLSRRTVRVVATGIRLPLSSVEIAFR